ncbi:NAD(P)-dependent oxidoreductase [Inmirania thermothiophila]|uniref:3-hydroxyisobutyrate dehydrogenase n=1 Tax=Inmirania thermothiophila TaxID=1750597 RepID=A0A3N1Y9M2_9GAMM|nr:NAD(P)-dependent oxidoreductase [Inmirania thermothiophila]ROR34312.1 3-hydroxyisobutyrate dehydrogenase [Inmirania thermothiophila]
MKTGFIGLGAMGAHMARNLHRAGHLEAVWNRTAAKAEALAAELGVAAAADPADLARRSEVVITCVSADRDVREVVEAMLPGLAPGKVVIDCSTVSAATARDVAARVASAGADFLDVPVTGGVEGARDARLSMMVGGEAAVLDRVRPVLEALSARIVHMGPVGAGQATKAVNQIMVAGINQAVTEGLAFAEAQGLDLARVIEAVSAGAAGSWFLTHRGPTMAQGRFAPGFKVALHHKDLAICRDMAAERGVHLRCVDETLADYEALMAEGHAEEDISALFRLKRRLFGLD